MTSHPVPAVVVEALGRYPETIRLGVSRSAPGDCAVFVNCKTTLFETFRAHFASDFAFEGQRALLIPAEGTLRREPAGALPARSTDLSSAEADIENPAGMSAFAISMAGRVHAGVLPQAQKPGLDLTSSCRRRW
jgi:hypothetical protein